MNKSKRSITKVIVPVFALVLMAFLISPLIKTFALIDETNSVHIKAAEIENSSLIIGSHLIHLSAMNDTIYETAKNSAADSLQNERYYKSELSEGVWYNVTEANSLSEITTQGVVVSNDVIEKLNMTHHTKSDRITYDLRTNQPVAVHNIIDPYNIEGISELSSIKLQHDNLSAMDEQSETDIRNLQLIRDLYAKDFTNDITKQYDAQIAALQTYYEILVRDEAEPKISDKVLKVMEKLDAARRVEVFTMLQEEHLNRLISDISSALKYDALLAKKLKGVEEETTEDEESSGEGESDVIEGFALDSNIISAVGDALGSVEESSNTYSSKMLAEGTTVLSKEEYNTILLLIQYAQSLEYNQCDTQVNRLIYLDHINNGVNAEIDLERQYLEETVVPAAKSAYKEAVSSGVGEEFKALPSTAAAATKKSVLKNHNNNVEMVREEMQFILTALFDRNQTEDAIAIVRTLIESVSEYSSAVILDDFKGYADTSIQEYEVWLAKQLKALLTKLGSGNRMDDLLAKKKGLQEERLTALDHNNLADAKRLEAEIEVVDMELADQESALNDILNSDTATAAEKATAAASLGTGSVSSAINNMSEGALSDIASGDMEGLENTIGAIGELALANPNSSLSALNDIYHALTNQKLLGNDSQRIDDLLSAVENTLADQIDSFTKGLTEEQLFLLLSAFMGKTIQELNDSEMASVLVALGMYMEETGSDAAKKLIVTYSTSEFNKGNRWIYQKYSQDLMKKYLPLDRLARAINYRYIFNDSQRSTVLQKGDDYYRFQAFYRMVERPEALMEDLETAPGFMEVVYVEEGYVNTRFQISCYYVPEVIYAVMLNQAMYDTALEFFNYLLEAGGM